MAEPSRPPSLPSSSDPVPYVPVSWMAVAALAVANLFVVVLLTLGYDAYRSKRPLLVEGLLFFPVVAVVLSFAARRMIRTSEGTRTGEGLANAAWWTAVVVGMGYVAYLFAIDYAVRRDARREVERWVGAALQDDVPGAFWLTLEPGRRSGIDKKDARRMENERRNDYLQFRQCDLIQLAERNPGACRFEPGSLRDWKQDQTVVDCSFTGVVVCPEGRFSLVVPLRGTEGVTGAEGVNPGRQWSIRNLPGYVQKAELSPYGWLLTDVRQQGQDFAREFIQTVASSPGMQPFAYMGYIRPGGDPKEWNRVPSLIPARAAVVGGFAALGGVPDILAEYTPFVATKFFTLPTDPREPSAEQNRTFQATWGAVGVLPAGARLRDTPDKNAVTTVTDTAVEVRVPIELPLPSKSGELEVARGRLVVACTDPAVMAELQSLRELSKTAAVTDKAPAGFGKAFAWRVVRVESDLKPVPIPRPGDQGGPGS